jgi:UDP-2-acetamido-2-deoxy-ribo-hexuluronate aminotransferase
MALGVQPGDEIIIPAFTYYATAEMPALLGAKPVFVDVDPETFNIDPEKIAEKITEKTKGIIPVSLYGQCADFTRINAVAQEHGLFVIEDGAQAFGSTYRGQKSCSFTTVATTSFFPSKPLGCYGDGGAVLTDDPQIAERMGQILNHGQVRRYEHKLIGINSRLDGIQAAILDVKLKYLDEEIQKRNAAAERYIRGLEGIAKTPKVKEDNISAWAQFTIQVDDRDRLVESLKAQGIPTAIHYPKPLYRQEALEFLGADPAEYPVSEEASQKVLSLPMHAFIAEAEIEQVVSAIEEHYRG